MTLKQMRRASLQHLAPPPRLKLSEWMERTIVLPEGDNAQSGRLRLYAYQREIADAISDPMIERVTLLKSARIGFSLLVTSAIASFVANEPAAVLLLLPTEGDCRDTMVSQIEPLFDASPSLRHLLADDASDRNTLLSKRFPGGSLKVVAAKSPRNLRRHTARILFIDEADGMDSGVEGNPLKLAENRTLTFANRKIIIGSTPVDEDTSHVIRAFGESDQRVFEVPCLSCGAFTEVMWDHIVWEPDRPETAAFRCPHCTEVTGERHKTQMVKLGEWRATRPDVKGHAGFRLNTLVSLLPNASWDKLAASFVAAKDDVGLLQVFTNTVLAQGWKTPSLLDDSTLAARAEPFDLNRIPPEVLFLTVGVDTQDDRLEISVCGWTRKNECLVLQHFTIWGSFTDAGTWDELAELLRSTWRHPFGGTLKIDAGVIDAGDGDHFDQVMNFCVPKLARRIFPGKGLFGARPAFAMSKGKRVGNRLALIGVDTLKSTIFDKLQHGRGIRFSDSLEPVYYEQLASERRVVRYQRGQPQRRFERIGRVRAEALDCLVYAHAARQSFRITFDHREAELRSPTPIRRSIASMLAK
jgi:phage terminase large subunit GpA-like protein